MHNIQDPTALIGRIGETLNDDKDILFAYLYGSAVDDPRLPRSDIDLAVCLPPSDMEKYNKKEAELTALLTFGLHTDAIDLRIMNVLPLVLQYTILKEGRLIFSRDEMQRADFETQVMIRFFELKPYLDEYRLMLSQRIRGF